MFSCNLWFIIYTRQFIKYYNKICFMFKNASSLLSDEMCISSPAIPNTACVAGSRKVQRCAGLTGFMSCTMRGITIILFCLHNNHTLWHFYPCIWKSVFYAKCLTPKQAFCRFFFFPHWTEICYRRRFHLHFLFTSEWSHWLVMLTKALSYMHRQSCTLVGVT